MSGFLHTITAFIAQYPHFAYAAVLLLALSESLPVIGALVPGSAVIIALSALVPSGTLKLWPMLLAALLGAIIGDGFAFWLGHRYHRQILGRWPLSRQPGLLAKSEAFFSRHGDKSVFIARFTPGVRAVVPLFAGILHMPVGRFYVANILSALIWAPSHILPGVLVGASLGFFGAAAEPLAGLAMLLVVLGWLALQAVRMSISVGYPIIERGIEQARTWAASQDSRLASTVVALLDPARSQARVLSFLGLLLAGAAWLFLGILEDVVSGDPLVTADQSIYRALQDLRSPPADAVMIAITELGDTMVVIGVTAAVVLFLAWRQAWRVAAYWLAAVAGASALNTVIKLTLHRARPGDLLYSGASAFSFPSGHSTTNMALYGFLGFLVAREVRPALRPSVGIAATGFILLIAVSRLYLGAHWFSDVVAGLAFGTVWLAALIISYLRGTVRNVGGGALLAVALMALGIGGGFNIYQHHASDTYRYAVQLPASRSMSAEEWRREGWGQLPTWRVDLFGETEEPMTIQWAGSLEALATKLEQEGWHVAQPLTPASALSFVAPGVDPAAIAVLPRFSGGQLPALSLVRDVGSDRRLVLHLWPSELSLEGVGPVWSGSVITERISRLARLLTVSEVESDFNIPRDELARSVPGGVLKARQEAASGWDGEVWLGISGAP